MEPGNANLPIGATQSANREIGVPRVQPVRYAWQQILCAGANGAGFQPVGFSPCKAELPQAGSLRHKFLRPGPQSATHN
jgi:hypothetical protein